MVEGRDQGLVDPGKKFCKVGMKTSLAKSTWSEAVDVPAHLGRREGAWLGVWLVWSVEVVVEI